ncbi:MAG: LysE family translocator [Acidisphaera sp.]|nr:LysE family translocator [Acidisphaera sp.]
MMSAELYLAFVLASSVLMLIPGPNVAVIVANSVAYGTRYGLLTVAGTSSAMLPQLCLTALGMTAVLGGLAQWFGWVRWVGAAYLIVLGVRQWRQRPVDLTLVRAQPRSVRAIYWRGFLVSLSNPKTLLFYSAFFPQFLDARAGLLPQMALLAATFLAVALIWDSAWALLAGRARALLAAHGRLRNRLTGGILIGAGAGLAAVRHGG